MAAVTEPNTHRSKDEEKQVLLQLNLKQLENPKDCFDQKEINMENKKLNKENKV